MFLARAICAAGLLALGAPLAGCYVSHDISGDAAVVRPSPVTMPCPDDLGVGSSRDCGFRVESTETCTPGSMVGVGCGCEGLGSCDGDPMLRVCRGDAACTSVASLANVDDRCGLCPFAGFVCPSEGRFTILTAPFSRGAYTCRPAVRR